MRIIKNIESTIGIASIIIALSPFVEEFKKIKVALIQTASITVYSLYFSYAIAFALFVLLQAYYEAFAQKHPNLEKRRKYLKLLNFAYYIVLTFIPIFLFLNLGPYLIPGGFEDEISNYSNVVFFISSVLALAFPYFMAYQSNFKNFETAEIIKDNLKTDIKYSQVLYQEEKLADLAILLYNIATKYLTFITDREKADSLNGSITDCIVKAYKENKISTQQKLKFEKIGETWDIANLTSKKTTPEFKQQVLINLWFLEEEINNSF